VLQNTESIGILQQTVNRIETNQNQLIEAVTNLAGEMKDFRLARATENAGFFRQESQLQDHERRIVSLEQRVS